MLTRKYKLVRLEESSDSKKEDIQSLNLNKKQETQQEGQRTFLDQENLASEDAVPVLFSSLSASILREKRARSRRETEVAHRTRCRHNAEIQTPGRRHCDDVAAGISAIDQEEFMVPLMTTLSLKDDVEMRTLLEQDYEEPTHARVVFEEGKRVEKRPQKTRKRSSNGLILISQSSLISSKVFFSILEFFTFTFIFRIVRNIKDPIIQSKSQNVILFNHQQTYIYVIYNEAI